MGNIYGNIQKEENREIVEKRNILIADKVCEILKSKLLLNKTILEFSKSEEYLSFEEFCNRLDVLIKKLITLEKDNPNRQYVKYEYNNFLKCYDKKVILNDQEIDKLLEYVRNSILRFGICQNQKEYSSSELVKFSLKLLNDYIKQNYREENKELISWIIFIVKLPESSFLKRNDVLYEIKDDGQEYFTIKEEGKKIFAINMDGEVSIDEELDYQNSLLNNDLYIGCIDYEGERIITILYQKDGNYYPVFFNQEFSNRIEKIEQRLKQNAKALISLSSLLEIKGLSHLIEPIYDKKILEYIALSINEKGYSMDKLIASNLGYLEEYPNEEIPSDELYLTKSGIIRQNKHTHLKEERQKNSAELNEVLKLSCLSFLIEKSYNVKKLEYILLSIKDNLHKIPSIVTEPAPPQKHLLTEIFYDVFYNLINPVEKKSIKENEDHLSHSFVKPLEKKVIRGIDDGLLEMKLRNLVIKVMGYSIYNKYCNYAQKRDDNFEYFAGIRKYFENVIVNYDSRSGITIYEYLDNYANTFNEHIEKNPHVKLLISALKRAYSDDPNDVIISHRGDSLIISRQDDKGKDDLPVACILNINSLETVLTEYVSAVKENDNYYKKVFSDEFGYTEQQAIEELFLWTLRNATTSDLANIERLFDKYTKFITDTALDEFAYKPIKIGDIFDDELYIILRKASIAYETPYYLRFMMNNKVVEFANMRYGIYNEGERSIAYIQAIQSSQQIPENDEYYEISNTIKRDLPKSRYFREFNPMHMASLVLFLGLINGLGIQEVHGSDYFSLRYQRLAIEKNKSEEEMNIYQHRLTNKFINTFMRLLEYTDDIDILKYSEDGDGFILKLNNDIQFSSSILQELYDMAYNATKKQDISEEKELKLK